MKKYYVAHVDFSEIETVTTDQISHDAALERLTAEGALNAKGKPDPNYLNALSGSFAAPFLTKLARRVSRRRGGLAGVYETFKKLHAAKEYTAMYLYMAILYGFIEWRVPDIVTALPASPDALKLYMSEFMADFGEVLNELAAENEPENFDESE